MKIIKIVLLAIIVNFGFLSTTFGQDFYDMNTIQTIEVSLSQSNWDQLMDDAYATTGDYIMADSVQLTV